MSDPRSWRAKVCAWIRLHQTCRCCSWWCCRKNRTFGKSVFCDDLGWDHYSHFFLCRSIFIIIYPYKYLWTTMNCHILEIHNYKITSRALSFGGGPLGSSRVVKRVVGGHLQPPVLDSFGSQFLGVWTHSFGAWKPHFPAVAAETFAPSATWSTATLWSDWSCWGRWSGNSEISFWAKFLLSVGKSPWFFLPFFLCLWWV